MNLSLPDTKNVPRRHGVSGAAKALSLTLVSRVGNLVIGDTSKPRHNAAAWRKSHSGGPGGVVSNQLLEEAAETHATMTALSDLGQDG